MTKSRGRRNSALTLTRPAKPLSADVLEVPEWLPEKGRELWRLVAPEMQRLGLLTVADAPAFLVMCLCYGEAMDAAQKVKDEGHTTSSDRGGLKKHPEVTILNEMLAQFRQWCVEFGMTPAARQRLKLLPEEEIDDMEQLLRKSRG